MRSPKYCCRAGDSSVGALVRSEASCVLVGTAPPKIMVASSSAVEAMAVPRPNRLGWKRYSDVFITDAEIPLLKLQFVVSFRPVVSERTWLRGLNAEPPEVTLRI